MSFYNPLSICRFYERTLWDDGEKFGRRTRMKTANLGSGRKQSHPCSSSELGNEFKFRNPIHPALRLQKHFLSQPSSFPIFLGGPDLRQNLLEKKYVITYTEALCFRTEAAKWELFALALCTSWLLWFTLLSQSVPWWLPLLAQWILHITGDPYSWEHRSCARHISQSSATLYPKMCQFESWVVQSSVHSIDLSQHLLVRQ